MINLIVIIKQLMQSNQIISVEQLDQQGFTSKFKLLKAYFAAKKLQQPHFWLYGGKIAELEPTLYVIVSGWNTTSAFNQYLSDGINKGAKLRNFKMNDNFAQPETGRVLELFSGFAKLSEVEALKKNMLSNVLPKIMSGAKGFKRISYGFNIYTGPEDLHQFVVFIMWDSIESQKALESSEDFRPLLIEFNQHLKYIYMYNIEIK